MNHFRSKLTATSTTQSTTDTSSPNLFPPSSPKWYGTRLSTVILVRRTTGEVLFVERDRVCADVKANEVVDGDVRPRVLDADAGRETQRVFRFVIGS